MTNENPLITAQDFTVASWDVDALNRLTTAAVGRFMQEAAESSARSLSIGYDELRRRNLAWILSGLIIRIDRYPRFRDQIRVETWPVDIVRRRALRDYRFLDADGAVFGSATTAWYLLDLARRRPVPPDQLRDRQWLSSLRALDRECDKLPSVEAPEQEATIPLRWSDLDLNDHLTNTRYQDLLLECVDEQWLRTHEIAEIELNFIAEGKYPDAVSSRRQAAPDREHTWLHSLVRQSDQKEICRGQIVWRWPRSG